MTQRIVRIAGTGSYLPDHVLTNDDLSKMVDTDDEWIRARTGIRQRHRDQRRGHPTRTPGDRKTR